jgi:hypothetical protein
MVEVGRWLFIVGVFLCFAGVQAGAAADISKTNPLIGTWLLVKYVDTQEGGEPMFAFGKDPVGHLSLRPVDTWHSASCAALLTLKTGLPIRIRTHVSAYGSLMFRAPTCRVS